MYDETATDLMAGHVHQILETLGENPDREGLLKTPERVAKAYQFLTHGYKVDPHAILTKAVFEEDYSEVILAGCGVGRGGFLRLPGAGRLSAIRRVAEGGLLPRADGRVHPALRGCQDG